MPSAMMRWVILALCALTVLSATVAWLFYVEVSLEQKELIMAAMRWGVEPDNYVNVSDSSFKEQVEAFVKICSMSGWMEIPEHSMVRSWAEATLGHPDYGHLNLRIVDDFYSVEIEYLHYPNVYLRNMNQVLSLCMALLWVVFAVMVIERLKQSQ